MMEHRGLSWGQLAGIAVADDGTRRLEKGIEDGRFALAELQVVYCRTDELRRFGDRGAQAHAVERVPILTANGGFDLGFECIPAGDDFLDEVLWSTELQPFESRHSVHHAVILDDTKTV